MPRVAKITNRMDKMEKMLKIAITSLSIVIFFTIIFYQYDHTHYKGFEEEDDIRAKLLNRLYFTMTTFSSTGYGDISPGSPEIKILSMILQFVLVMAMMAGIMGF